VQVQIDKHVLRLEAGNGETEVFEEAFVFDDQLDFSDFAKKVSAQLIKSNPQVNLVQLNL
jgi:hypothetical protein